jgi:hypothetical protein
VAPALFHDFGHSLGTSSRDWWSVVDPWITDLTKNLSWMLSFVRNLSAIDLVHDHSFFTKSKSKVSGSGGEIQLQEAKSGVPKA